VSLIEEIDTAYEGLRGTRRELHLLESVVAEFREIAIRELYEELKGARSVEARNQAIAVHLHEDNEYRQACEDLSAARLAFDLAKDEVDRVKLLARVEDYGG